MAFTVQPDNLAESTLQTTGSEDTTITTTVNPFEELPVEILYKILQNLNFVDLNNALKSCRCFFLLKDANDLTAQKRFVETFKSVFPISIKKPTFHPGTFTVKDNHLAATFETDSCNYHLIDLKTKQIKERKALTSRVQNLVFFNKDMLLVGTVLGGSRCRLENLSTGEVKPTFEIDGGPQTNFMVTPPNKDGICVAARDFYASSITIIKPTEIGAFEELTDEKRRCCADIVNGDESFSAIYLSDIKRGNDTERVYFARTYNFEGETLNTIYKERPILKMTRDNEHIVLATRESLDIHDVKTGEKKHSIPLGNQGLTKPSVHIHEGKLYVNIFRENQKEVLIIDLSTGEKLHSMESTGRTADFAADKNTLVFSNNKSVKILDLTNLTKEKDPENPVAPVMLLHTYEAPFSVHKLGLKVFGDNRHLILMGEGYLQAFSLDSTPQIPN